FKDNPSVGIGVGNYPQHAILHSENYFINELNEPIFYDQPESGYWMILSEIGILGFILVFGFIFLPILNNIKRHLKGHFNFYTFFIIAGLFSWSITFISLYSLNDKRILIPVITFV